MNTTPKDATREPDHEQPTFIFFRTTPPDITNHPPLASSLQSFETCLLLIALGRFPSALASCATAVESVIKAKLGTPLDDQVRMWELIEEIRRVSPTLRLFDETKLEHFRETRNRVVHYGYTPKDDELCALQLLETGLPFLEKCYRDLFGFALISGPGGVPQGGLDPKLARHYATSKKVYLRARELRGITYGYCLNPLAHYIRLAVKSMTTSVTEANMLEIDADSGVRFEHEERAKRKLLERHPGPTEEFDCPLCEGQSSMVAEMDAEASKQNRVSVRWCYCVSCGMLVSDGSPYLADEILRIPIEVRAQMLKELGLS
jgi:hypothetical protein